MFLKAFWIGTTDRALKSAAQALLLMWGGTTFNVLQIDPAGAFGVAAGALVLSVLTSVVSSGVGDLGTPSALPGSLGSH